MTDEPKKNKAKSDPQGEYNDHVESMRKHFTDSPHYLEADLNLRMTAVDQAVKWMVGRGSNPTTDLVKLADRLYRFMRYMPDQEPNQ